MRYATEDEYLGDDTLYVYCSRLGMGLSVLASQHLFAPIEQIVVWDGRPASGNAGTAIDVDIWRETGRPLTIIPITPEHGSQPPESPSRSASNSRRSARAMLFGDLQGFSRLTDRELPNYVTGVLGAIEHVRQAHRNKVLLANTWGDGLYLVFDTGHATVCCARSVTLSRLIRCARFPVPLSLGSVAIRGRPTRRLDPVFGHTTSSVHT